MLDKDWRDAGELIRETWQNRVSSYSRYIELDNETQAHECPLQPHSVQATGMQMIGSQVERGNKIVQLERRRCSYGLGMTSRAVTT